MSEAIHEVAHEATHSAAHSEKSRAKLIGLLISVLALFLAVSEMLGKSAQTRGLAETVQASDTWNFFQAKTVRQTVIRTMLESAKASSSEPTAQTQTQLSAWQATIARLESEPQTGEGRKELIAKANAIEKSRDEHFEKYHAYEMASLLLQLGIVLASVSLLSSITGFAYASGALAIGGMAILIGAYFTYAPLMTLLH